MQTLVVILYLWSLQEAFCSRGGSTGGINYDGITHYHMGFNPKGDSIVRTRRFDQAQVDKSIYDQSVCMTPIEDEGCQDGFMEIKEEEITTKRFITFVDDHPINLGPKLKFLGKVAHSLSPSGVTNQNWESLLAKKDHKLVITEKDCTGGAAPQTQVICRIYASCGTVKVKGPVVYKYSYGSDRSICKDPNCTPVCGDFCSNKGDDPPEQKPPSGGPNTDYPEPDPKDVTKLGDCQPTDEWVFKSQHCQLDTEWEFNTEGPQTAMLTFVPEIPNNSQDLKNTILDNFSKLSPSKTTGIDWGEVIVAYKNGQNLAQTVKKNPGIGKFVHTYKAVGKCSGGKYSIEIPNYLQVTYEKNNKPNNCALAKELNVQAPHECP